jgi:glycosyltransferase involved in cell wall biosynthesis
MTVSDSRLSVVVITKNERENLPRCLTSVSFADDLLVVDAFSSDGTPEVARAHAARVLQRAWDGYVPQRQYGFDRAVGEWILWLDADERVTPELAGEIRAALRNANGTDAYRIPRRHYFLGDWLRYGDQYPAYQVRLMRREKAHLTPSLYHESIDESTLAIGSLQGAIDHYSTPTLRSRLGKIGRDARLAAQEAVQRGTLSAIPVGTLLVNPLRRMGYLYLRKQGYRDGWRGLVYAGCCGLEQALIAARLLTRRLKRRRG